MFNEKIRKSDENITSDIMPNQIWGIDEGLYKYPYLLISFSFFFNFCLFFRGWVFFQGGVRWGGVSLVITRLWRKYYLNLNTIKSCRMVSLTPPLRSIISQNTMRLSVTTSPTDFSDTGQQARLDTRLWRVTLIPSDWHLRS